MSNINAENINVINLTVQTINGQPAYSFGSNNNLCGQTEDCNYDCNDNNDCPECLTLPIPAAQGAQGEQVATGAQGSTGPEGKQGATGLQGATGVQGATGAQGATGVQGATGPEGKQGATGAQGATGVQGATGSSSIIAYAEYTKITQTGNIGVTPGVPFLFDLPAVYNSAPSLIEGNTGAGGVGTVFTLQSGTYIIDYETSLGSAGSLAIYSGSSGSLVLDTNTISGSSTATTWIHGRAVQVVPLSLDIAISSYNGNATVVLAGTSDVYMIRITILKIE
uniref:Uncharacterized protein n=1 Tax=viral metagenome TaxID=1070528 RepID=A0A6C0KRE3_9ZZZZ